MPRPVTLTLSGAAGQIGYSLLFRVASGELLGPDTPVRVRMLERPDALGAAEGVALELQDAASPLLADVAVTADPRTAFDGADHAILVGARPRTAGMERADLLEANGAIFRTQGAAINDVAADDVRVLVIGNPANTNTMIAAAHAPDVPADRFTALTRLDHNRALAQLALRAGVSTREIARVTVWGNHSRTQYPDLRHALVGGRPALEVVDRAWAEGEFIETVAQRGSAIIAARGGSSVASTVTAIVDHVRLRRGGTPPGDWSSAGRVSDGSYGVPAGLVCSFPVTAADGDWHVVPGLEVDAFSRARIDASVAELADERDAVRHLGLL
ncbi:malate dehydrogenase [Cellulomonas pakistanensis]|uniref:Malate dehydrogenase n=1 Tax=Cellulomonas pakistanensis TaxID=992287 RepID=A0A919PAR2_9CELL|nr:malate dehydrogenase [Cellulomonas pakistanensis]GIG36125.1 malate dehydrogenase [Cellulomonas pakistanensis]